MKIVLLLFVAILTASCGFQTEVGSAVDVSLTGVASENNFTLSPDLKGNDKLKIEYEWTFDFTDNAGVITNSCKVDFALGNTTISDYDSGPGSCSSYPIAGPAFNPNIQIKGSRAQPVQLDYCLRVRNQDSNEVTTLVSNCSSLTSTGTPLPSNAWLSQLGASTVASGGSNAGYDACSVHDVDYTGAIYCAGYTNGSMGEANGGNYDAFVAKFNVMGGLEWVKQYGATTVGAGGSNAGLDVFYALRVDRDLGYVYVGGYTRSSMAEANGGGNDQIVIKLDFDGNQIWEKQFGNTSYPGQTAGHDNVTAIDFDELGNVYVLGEVNANFIEPSAGGWDMSLIKMDAAGNVVFMKRVGATSLLAFPGANASGRETCNAAVYHAGYVYCAGEVSSGVAETHGGSKDAFLIKFDALNGDIIWMNQLGADSVTPAPASSDTWWSVSIGPDMNSLYLSGATGGNVGEVAAGTSDIIFAKYDLDGNNIWFKQYGSVTAGPNDNSLGGYCIIGERYVGLNGYIYCAGTSNGDFVEASGGAQDVFAMKMDLDANIIWATQLGSITGFAGQNSAGADYIAKGGAVLDSMNNIYMSGQTSAGFGEATGGGGQDAFFVKIQEDGSI